MEDVLLIATLVLVNMYTWLSCGNRVPSGNFAVRGGSAFENDMGCCWGIGTSTLLIVMMIVMALDDSFWRLWKQIALTPDGTYKVRLLACLRSKHVLRIRLITYTNSCIADKSSTLALVKRSHRRKAWMWRVDWKPLLVMNTSAAFWWRERRRSLFRKVRQVGLILAEFTLVNAARYSDRASLLTAS